jgi:soluble lytic murein transglycosylase-like protein
MTVQRSWLLPLKIFAVVAMLLGLVLGVTLRGTSNDAPRAPARPVIAPAVAPPPLGMPAPVAVSVPQAAVAKWIGTKYHVAPEAIAPLVAEADKLAAAYRLSPQLLMAVMAIESNFHPYIQSEAGAQGLMQVMPLIHAKRYEKFGGKGSFVDPIVSLKVGAEILRDCIKLRGGSETEALRFYFGGGPASDGYIDKVRAEQRRLVLASTGAHPPID